MDLSEMGMRNTPQMVMKQQGKLYLKVSKYIFWIMFHMGYIKS